MRPAVQHVDGLARQILEAPGFIGMDGELVILFSSA
jgi:hypothetical protein